MAFAIEFVGDEFEEEGVRLHGLMLTVGDFFEEMFADVTNWSITDYRQHWLKELDALVHGRDCGALLTSLHDPKIGYRVQAWPMWREDNIVYFQSRVIGMLEVEPNFDTNRLSGVIGERQELSEDGRPISQWQISASEIKAFLTGRVTA